MIPTTRGPSADYKPAGLNRGLVQSRTKSDMLLGQEEGSVEDLQPLPDNSRDLTVFLSEIYEMNTPLSHLPSQTVQQLKTIGNFVKQFMSDRGYKENVGTFKKILSEQIEEELGLFREDLTTNSLLERLFGTTSSFGLIKEARFKDERIKLFKEAASGGDSEKLKEAVLKVLGKATKKSKKKK